MSTLVQFPNPRKSREEACAWIARIDAGLSEADRSALDDWLAASPDHAALLLEIGKLWDDMEVMTELAELFPLKARAEAAARQLPRIAWGLIAAAAGLAVVVVAWWLVAQPTMMGGTGSSPKMAGGYETRIGEQSSVRLSDGTRLVLNTDTKLTVDYRQSERIVVLERGEASFDVAEDSARPFMVYAGQRVVQAVGTIFNVQLGPNDEVEVAVTEGRVRVLRLPDSPTEMPTGSVLRPIESVAAMMLEEVVDAGHAVLVENEVSTVRELDAEDIDVELAWQRGTLVFRGEPLDVVLREVGRYTTVEFELANSDMASLRVGGYFRAGEIDGLLVALKENFNIQATQSGDRIVLEMN